MVLVDALPHAKCFTPGFSQGYQSRSLFILICGRRERALSISLIGFRDLTLSAKIMADLAGHSEVAGVKYQV